MLYVKVLVIYCFLTVTLPLFEVTDKFSGLLFPNIVLFLILQFPELAIA